MASLQIFADSREFGETSISLWRIRMEIFGALKIAPMLIAVQFEVNHAKSDRIIGPQISYGVPLLAALFFVGGRTAGRQDGRAGTKKKCN